VFDAITNNSMNMVSRLGILLGYKFWRSMCLFFLDENLNLDGPDFEDEVEHPYTNNNER
jgi:hypothetical protein